MAYTAGDTYELATTVADVKTELGLGTTTPEQDAFIEAITRRVQSSLENYLNRMVTIRQVMDPNARADFTYPVNPVTYDLGVPRQQYYLKWPDVHTIVSATRNPNGTFQVVYIAGLDGRNIAPIKDYLSFAAMEAARAHPRATEVLAIQRTVSSVTAASQTVAYDPLPAGDAAGAAPTLESVSRWKYRTVVT